MHLQWARWQVSSQGLYGSLLRLQTPVPWIWEQGSQGTGVSLHWEASQERFHSGLHDGAEPWCLTVPIPTPGYITPDCRGSWNSWLSHSPFCVTPAAGWFLPLGKGWGPGTASLLSRARHLLCCGKFVVYLMHTLDTVIFLLQTCWQHEWQIVPAWEWQWMTSIFR